MRNNQIPRLALLTTFATALAACSQRPIYLVKAEGNEALATGDYAVARANYAEWAERERANPEAHYHLGRALLAAGEPRRAREQLEIAYSLDRDNLDYLDALVDSLVASGRTDDLFRLLRPAAEDQPSAETYARLGRAAARAGLADEAQLAFRQAIATEPNDPTGYRALATFYQGIGDQARESRALRVLLGLEPGDHRVSARLRELGQVPGPSYVLTPEEYLSATR